MSELHIDLDQIGVSTDAIDITINGSGVYYDGYITVDTDDIDLPTKKLSDHSSYELVRELVQKGVTLENLIVAFLKERGV